MHKVRDDEDQDGGLGLDELEHEEQQVHGEDGEAQGDDPHIQGVPEKRKIKLFIRNKMLKTSKKKN